MVERFETLIGEIVGVDHVVAVTSGTTALVVALEALELDPGDEIITSPFTFAATLNAILEAGVEEALPQIAGLYHVRIRIEHLETVLHGASLLRSKARQRCRGRQNAAEIAAKDRGLGLSEFEGTDLSDRVRVRDQRKA